MAQPSHIRVVVAGVFIHQNRILVFEGYDSVKGSYFYRPLGGGIQPGETSIEALKREILEELGKEIQNERLLGVLENFFTWEGKEGHQICFVYRAEFVEKAVYEQDGVAVIEKGHDVPHAIWKNLNSFNDTHRLTPDRLTGLLEQSSQ